MTAWIELDGLVNLRDVGGTPTTDGETVPPGRLLRSDNLQDLTPADVDALRAQGVTDVVDLRSAYEVADTGPGPLTRETWVRLHHHSFLDEDGLSAQSFAPPVPPESSAGGPAPEPVAVGHDRDAADVDAADLPWVGAALPTSDDAETDHALGVTSHYLSYLTDRPDSVVAALRVIAGAEGSVLVHCAAGKDRTGTLVALALLLVGAEPEAVVADYATSNERVDAILERLASTPTYGPGLRRMPRHTHLTRPATMRAFIEQVAPGGDPTALQETLDRLGWTPEDSARLRAKLRG